MTKLHELRTLGQSIWFDYISRDLLDSGDLTGLLDSGVRGVTSNPSIFAAAVSTGQGYDADLELMALEGKTPLRIYEDLAVADIRRAADALLPVYRESNGMDGFVSLEVNPDLAQDASGTVVEALRLHRAVGRPNLMVKVPATGACIPAVTALIACGVNVNATLLFSRSQYAAVANAYIDGLELLALKGGDLRRVASVASVFVSRIDTALDPELTAKSATDLVGKVAVANARAIYADFRKIFSGPRWQSLAEHGAQLQRPLWASTGVKNPAYPDTLYVETLIGPDTVNTTPPATLKAYMDHGQPARTIDADPDGTASVLDRLPGLGIDLGTLGEQLLTDGLCAFSKAFAGLIDNVRAKSLRITSTPAAPHYALGPIRAQVEAAARDAAQSRVMNRIWSHDHTVWKPEPTEITNRLGWLHTAGPMADAVGRLKDFAAGLLAEGFTHALLLGMGGSSLAPEVFNKVFGGQQPGLDVQVLDSTDPARILHYVRTLDPARTLYIVSTKSGGTVETFSFCKYFHNMVAERLGAERAGRQFIVVTDPGSALEQLAKDFNFRDIFLNDPNIGGRFSVLSCFGLVPAALVGVDLDGLITRAANRLSTSDGPDLSPDAASLPPDSGAYLGVIMAEAAKLGRDKLTLIASPAIAPFGAWAEQLIAESSGKEGVGILPVDGESILAPEAYAADRLFIHLRLDGDASQDGKVAALARAGHPVIRIHLNSLLDLGGEFLRFEIATAVACARLGVNAFDQPDVESAKVSARAMVAAFKTEGRLPALTPVCSADGLTALVPAQGSTPYEALRSFIAQAVPGQSYISLQAYINPTPQTDAALHALRTALQTVSTCATTVGYGPRFLHSTGQLHKGDAGHGLFIQFTCSRPEDTPIPDSPGQPDSSMTFGTLIEAQSLGDREALLSKSRRLLRLDLGPDPVTALYRLTWAVTK